MAGSLDWQNQWVASLLWTVEAFALTILGCGVVAWLVTRYTVWGRQLHRLAFPYFRPGRDMISWRPLTTALLMLLLIVVSVRINVLISYAINGLYTALQELDPRAFARFLSIFGVLATIYVIRTMVEYFVGQAFIIHWRTWLNDHVVNDWLSGHAYHRSRFVRSPVDNPDQRIQEDVTSFATDSRSLALGTMETNSPVGGAVESVVSMVSFTVILWDLSGPITIFGTEIPRAITFMTYVYVILASVIAFRIGRPLIRLSFLNEGLGASFRYALVRLRSNSEYVAFYRGEDVERATLSARFAAVIRNVWRIVFWNVMLQGFNLSVSQLAVVFPFIIQAPRFFSGAIKLGDMLQTATAFGRVHDALSFFRNTYDEFAAYRATLNRLTGLLDADIEARQLPTLRIEDRPEGLKIRDLTVRRPDAHVLIEGLTFSLAPGDTLLVKGPSGSGKTCLLRSLADLWPYASGSVSRPDGAHTIFLSQQPYVPLGSLRAALVYPGPVDLIDDDQACRLLRKVQLGHLITRIDDGDWTSTLSPGEQQRVGFARILVSRPRLAFLDEATSALDEGIEHALYTLVRDELPDCVLVSVSHRSSLDGLHSSHLQLLGDGRWKASLPIVGER